MKLTTDLIAESVSHINAISDRELVLRDLKIPAIENLGATKDLNDTIDLTNNDLRSLGNFPRLVRLQHILLANNRISAIEEGLQTSLPNLTTLVLTNNSIQELGDLEPLVPCRKLKYLSLLDNPVTKKKYYRLYIVHKLPTLRVLDFIKIKQSERDEGKQLFKDQTGNDTSLSKSLTDAKSRSFEPGEGLLEGQKANGHGLTAEEQRTVREALKNATSLDEISRLERVLKAGHVPTERKTAVAEEEEMDERE
ncbi:u2 small nuclear ribonucleoprotein A'-like protein [Spinellus fusiger]|nr:u2 small nuclear ribonucleoprotein A'-like protein [Spinellus fusiger]